MTAEGGYANLALNKALREQRLGGRDAAFCTELVHGTLRWQGTYDAFLARNVSRPIADLDPELLDLLRLGTHQLLRMRVDSYAAVSEMVTLTRAEIGQKRSGLVNAVLRKISQRSLDQWIGAVAPASRRRPRRLSGDRQSSPTMGDRSLRGSPGRENGWGHGYLWARAVA